MAREIRQGDLLSVERIALPVLVVSKDFFNSSGEIIGCPIMQESSQSPLHIYISAGDVEGYVQCEKMALLDLNLRGHKKIGAISFADKINIADAIQGIFDYIM
ncbi:MAG: type II toxin-antitoxin system PemK/MazF family toxin [Clostridiales bacterium]|nr:type II toxin-antitoxin system PemK/MazF family toxin [Clostridiales bacterium]